MKTKDWGRGRRGGGGLIERGGINFLPLKRGDLLERGGVAYLRGGLIEDLRYLCCIKCGTS